MWRIDQTLPNTTNRNPEIQNRKNVGETNNNDLRGMKR